MKLTNLNLLLDDMKKRGWHITAFTFRFYKVTALIVVEDAVCHPLHQKDTLAYFTCYDANDVNNSPIGGEVKTYFWDVKLSEIKRFFHLRYIESKDVKSWRINFYSALNNAIPTCPPEKLKAEEKKITVQHLNNKDDDNRTCIFAVKHNANHGQRSVVNSEKARLLCPDVYYSFYKDSNISFCFRETNPLSLQEIRRNFAKNPEPEGQDGKFFHS